jgi:hypothetical protein
MVDTETASFDDYPQVKYMPAGNQAINVIVNGNHYFRSTNVDEIKEAAKEYKRAYDNACSLSDQGSEFPCTVPTNDCICLRDAYENLMGALSPYERWNFEGILDKDNEGNFFLGGYNTPIPDPLKDLILEYQEEGFDTEPLVNFWEKLLLNPNEQVRENLMEFIRRYGITITDEGYILTYKVVRTKQENTYDEDLAGFVATEYVKRKNWGKNPADYYVYDLDVEITLPNNHTAGPGLYVSTMEEMPLAFWDEEDDQASLAVGPINDLESLHENIDELQRGPERTVYTDKYSGTKDYRLGEVHGEPREECDPDPARACSTGLHTGAKEYVDWYSSYRDDEAIMACLTSPEKVVCVPEDHDFAKIRQSEFFALGLMEQEEDGHWSQLDDAYFQEDYNEYDREELQRRLDDLEMGDTNEEDDDIVEDQKKVIEDRLVEL